MQKRVFLILVLIGVAVIPAVMVELNRPTTSNGDPCDSYGNCIFSSVSYVRSNPDQSLYFGDEFSVILSTSTGPNTTSVSIGWSYDSAVLSALGGGLFQVVGNVTGTYSVTVTETFTVVETVGNSTVTIAVTALDERIGRDPRIRACFPHGDEQRHKLGPPGPQESRRFVFPRVTSSSSTTPTASSSCSSAPTSRSSSSRSSTRTTSS